jgi:hypothetical protein
VNRFTRLLVLVAGLAFFIALVLQAGVRELAATLARTGWAFLLLVAVWGVVYVSNTIAWRALIGATAPIAGPAGQSARIPFLPAYAITVASFAINYATPFVALGGEPLKIAQAADWIGVDRAAASVVSFRVTHTLGQMLFWLLAVPIGWVLLPHTLSARLGLLAAGVTFSIGVCLLILVFRHGFVVRALDALHHIPVLRRLAPRLERFRPTLAHVDGQLAVLTANERPRLVVAVFFEVVGRCIAMFEYYIVAWVEGIHISYPQAFFIGAISQLTIIILIFVPLELGSREGGTRLGYTLLHLSPALGVYAGVITHLRELTWIAIGLVVAWGLQRGAKRLVASE